jgi:hypothetical protein
VTIILTALGAVLLLAGVVLSFHRHDTSTGGETKVEYKGIKITATKPSIVLILVGALLVVLPHIPGVTDSPKDPVIPGLGPSFVAPGGATPNFGTRCCFPGGACSMFAPDILGGPCLCWDMVGNMAAGTVCQ